ncbi:MAG: hypothetical protein IIA64_05270 [Planctomycetes bacterium]|nr:hypothetical protein [Planctomycetota bacterium]
MTSPAPATKEPIIALPIGRMVGSIVGLSGLTYVGCLAVVWLGGFGIDAVTAGLAGSALVAAVGVAAALLMRPWRPRPLSAWTTWWLAGIVGRLLVTPAVAYLLYSATSLSGTPLLLSVATTYVIVQCGEAAVLALHIKRVT